VTFNHILLFYFPIGHSVLFNRFVAVSVPSPYARVFFSHLTFPSFTCVWQITRLHCILFYYFVVRLLFIYVYYIGLLPASPLTSKHYYLHGRSQWPRSLRPLAYWDCGLESHRGHGMSVSCECCVLSGRGLCDGLITCPGESYRVWRV
jgi:hypothetical protein